MARLIVLWVTLFILPALSWTISAYMDLVHPPRWTTDIGDAYLVKDGEIQDAYYNALGSCLNKPVPTNVTRTPFSITDGSLRFAFVNRSRGGEDTGEFRIDMYFKQDPWGLNKDFDSPVWMKRMQFWHGFSTGDACTVPMDLRTRLKDPNNTSVIESLEGLNVTFGLQVINYRGESIHPFEQVDQVCHPRHLPLHLFVDLTCSQCAYVTLTLKDTDAPKGTDSNPAMCNRVNLDYFYGGETAVVTEGSPEPTNTDSSALVNIPTPGAVYIICGLAVYLLAQ